MLLQLGNASLFNVCFVYFNLHSDKIDVAYDIPGTATTFTGTISQKAAANAAFETYTVRNYSDVLDEDGHELFRGIPEKLFKVMGKQFPRSQ